MTKPEDILGLRRWDAVLFTTYAFSISFFESYVLHHLRQKGFDEIWVIADAEGYQNSLMERRAWGAGRDYHLIPVSLPKGVFHCKCAYLSSKEGDVLLIGSGNATFGGFGKNLEALQVLTPDVAPNAFSEFADFLDLLGRRSDFLNPERRWIEGFTRRARVASAAAQVSSDSGIHLVHSVERPIIEQLCRALEFRAPIERLLVLSPYHDSNGHAVKVLADGVRCSRIAVGLPTNPKTPSAFPFPLAKSWKMRVSAVRPDAPPASRPLHAKWFEFAHKGGVATLVGSVNATSQALCTTNNVELGVLRFDPNEKTLGTWKKAEVPDSFRPNEFPCGDQGQILSVHAVLRSDGYLTGRMLTSSNCSGTWDSRLEFSSGETIEFKAPVRSDNTFRLQFPGNVEETLSSTLQLILRRGGSEARGWVHVEEVLALPERERLVLGAIGRFVRGRSDQDDDIMLLEYLAASAIRHLNAFDIPLKFEEGPEPKSSQQEENTAIELGMLEPDAHAAITSDRGDASGGAQTYILDKWFGQLRRRLLAPAGLATAVVSSLSHFRQPNASASGEADEEEKLQKTKQVESALERFDKGMRHLLELPDGDARMRRTILAMWLEVKLNMLAFRLADRAGAKLFARDWFERATRQSHLGSEVSALEQHAFAIAGAMPFILDDKGCGEPTYAALHEDLERFCRGAVPFDRAIESARQSAAWLAGALLKGREAALVSSLSHVLESRTLRQEVDTIISCLNSHQPIPENSAVYNTPEGQALREALAASPYNQEFLVVANANDGCPHCHMGPTAKVEQSLMTARVARCSHCNRFLLRNGI
jgi:hypothetical protein